MRICFALIFILFTSCTSTQYFIVRHAEKELTQAGSAMMTADPPLSPAGKVRAIELREELKDDNIRHIFSTNYLRTRETARPLSEMRGIQVRLYNSKDPMDSLVKKLSGLKGNVLIVGHSNTVDDIVNALMGSRQIEKDLPETDYDNLFVVKKKGKKLRFEARTYGTATE